MNNRIFEYNSYKKFVVDLVSEMPRQGYGQYKKIAEKLGVASVNVSQVFKGDRDLQPEHIIPICDYLNLTEDDRNYFLLLVLHSRAGTFDLKNYYEQQMKSLRQKVLDTNKVIVNSKELEEQFKVKYYSHWLYAATRLLTYLPGKHSIESMANYFKIPISVMREAVDFLVNTRMIEFNKNSGYSCIPVNLSLDKDSPLKKTRHTSWRLKGIDHMNTHDPDSFFYTLNMSTSETLIEELKADLIELTKKYSQKIEGEKDETLACFNIDLFKF